MAQQSFFGSIAGAVKSGIGSMFKGSIALGIVGALVGAVMGAIAAPAGGMLAGAAAVAVGLGLEGAVVGGFLGAITGVLKSREQHGPDAQDVVNVANMAFAQGVAVGRGQEIGRDVGHTRKTDHFQQQLAAEKSGAAIAAR